MRRFIQIVLSIGLLLPLSACAAASPPAQSESAVSEEIKTGVTAATAPSETATESSSQTGAAADEKLTIDSILASMTAEEKVGQLLLARFPESGAEEVMDKYHVGGFTLYAADFKLETPESMPEKLAEIQSRAFVPAFMAVDEEGGTVVRVSKFPQYRPMPFSSQIALARGGEELIESETREKSELLLSLGLNLNLAPVADITEDHSAYIFDRTFGTDLEKTAAYTALTVNIMNECGIGSCLKHFPGYGPNPDTHSGAAVDDRPEDDIAENDLIPFISGIDAGAPSVMVCHNIVNAYDSELPASLSPAVHGLLRNELGFEGVIISDDMGMEAILQYSGEESPYVLAVLAGNDMICTSDIEKAYNDIRGALSEGKIEEARIDESVKRILEMKKSLGLF